MLVPFNRFDLRVYLIWFHVSSERKRSVWKLYEERPATSPLISYNLSVELVWVRATSEIRDKYHNVKVDIVVGGVQGTKYGQCPTLLASCVLCKIELSEAHQIECYNVKVDIMAIILQNGQSPVHLAAEI